jgi:protein phosphatase 2C family protein 2/3
MGIKGGAKALSFDHKPMLPIERARIDAAGGFVQWNRVNGDLAVSRALGDFSFKDRPDLPPESQKVSTASRSCPAFPSSRQTALLWSFVPV